MVRIRMNNKAVREVLNSGPIRGVLEREAEKIKGRAGGDGYVVSVQRGKVRAHARVATATREKAFEERKTNRLLKASGGGPE